MRRVGADHAHRILDRLRATEGRVEGRVEGLASALDQFAAAIGLPVPPERRAHWLTMTPAELERLAKHVFEHKAWPSAD